MAQKPLMPEVVFRWFVASTDPDGGLVPASAYVASFYEAGTDIPKTIYDIDGNPFPSPSNQAILNQDGWAEIRLGIGGYKLKVLRPDPDFSPVYEQDNIRGGGTFGTGFADTIAGDNPLKDIDPADSVFTYVGGYYEIGDGGEGMFYNKDSADPDDGGYVIASDVDPDKRWFRISDESFDVRAASFGYIGSKTGNYGDELSAAAAYAYGNNLRLVIGPGNVAKIGTSGFTFQLDTFNLYLGAFAVLTGDTGVDTIHISGMVTGTDEKHFATGLVPDFLTPQTMEFPSWFGLITGEVNDEAFNNWLLSLPNGGAFILPPGPWNYSNVNVFPYPPTGQPFILLGKIVDEFEGLIPTGVYFPDDSRFRLNEIVFPSGAQIIDSGATVIDITAASVNFSDSIDATGAIVAGQNMTAGGSIKAGDVGEGFLSQRLGTGTTTNSPAVSTQYSTIADATANGAGEQPLLSRTLEADSLTADGDAIRVTAGGTLVAGNSDSFDIRLKVGGTSFLSMSIVDASSAANPTKWHFEALIIKEAGNVRGSGFMVTNATAGSAPSATTQTNSADYNSIAKVMTASAAIAMFANRVAGSPQIVQHYMILEYIKAKS